MEDGKMARDVIDAELHVFWDVARVFQKSWIIVERYLSTDLLVVV